MTFDDLKNAIVLITGGANGIGEACCRAFAAQGARVRFCDVDSAAGEKLAKELSPAARFTKVDLTQEAQIVEWIESIGKEGPIRALLNNAARDPRRTIAETTTKEWDDLFALNLRACFLTTREASRHMTGCASIINFSSITFEAGVPSMSNYISTKGGIVGFTRAAARELGPRGIRVNTIAPGWVMTERQIREYVTPDAKAKLPHLQCTPDLLQPSEIANVALFLASSASSAITGQHLFADKGWILH